MRLKGRQRRLLRKLRNDEKKNEKEKFALVMQKKIEFRCCDDPDYYDSPTKFIPIKVMPKSQLSDEKLVRISEIINNRFDDFENKEPQDLAYKIIFDGC